MNLILTLLATIPSAVTTSSQLLPTRRLTHRATCPSCPVIVPLFRSFDSAKNDHLYTHLSLFLSRLLRDMLRKVWRREFSPRKSASRRPSSAFFRLYNDGLGHHAYTINTTEVQAFLAAGYVLETIPGYVYAAGICGSVPLYCMLLASRNDYFYTSELKIRLLQLDEAY
ncbi:hypothetical protein B0H14DRAFT_2684674 [Mycena olivaceomarginata]|nr:hypothetical protein B0H14DRAFT_2684674 [Mycena olivaceomarginata]